MRTSTNQADLVTVVFVFPKKEQTEEILLTSAELTALLHAKQVWIEKFSANLKIENTVWSNANNKISLQVYLK
ncbi:hypothetical protein [Oceanobacillus sp. J11TS1]|uniref:hypothetical protein n=1 Tax=Oceanobacillus sp. J11TS1 TaxID=2807191 RepID=UPI001B2E206D|nr:hypothetical protein [Oceanobacillus sp. J11TS1]GIO24206.1 hypothetical protein J11TS1_27870 [Oceanobacillus sp. J11TS1]